MSKAMQHRKKRKLYFMQLLGGKCIKCGTMDGLEFDHIDPSTKEFNISQILDRSMERISKEVAKCQLLCKQCHGEKTGAENAARYKKEEYTHGTDGTYSNHGCRCVECTSAHAKYHKQYIRDKRWSLKALNSSTIAS